MEFDSVLSFQICKANYLNTSVFNPDFCTKDAPFLKIISKDTFGFIVKISVLYLLCQLI